MPAIAMLAALTIILAASLASGAHSPVQAAVTVCFVPAERDCFIQMIAAIGAAQAAKRRGVDVDNKPQLLTTLRRLVIGASVLR